MAVSSMSVDSGFLKSRGTSPAVGAGGIATRASSGGLIEDFFRDRTRLDMSQRTTRTNSFLPSALYVLRLLSICLFAVLFLEVVLRVLHRGSHPIIPYQVEDRIPSLPFAADFYSTIGDHPPAHYITDDLGARIASADVHRLNCENNILVVGDSQALGWGMPFEETFAARLSQAVSGDTSKARILAAPATDPEHEFFALERYAGKCRGRQRATVLVLNMGNDLDEMYTGRQSAGVQRRGIASWLALHSYLYVDVMLVKNKMFGIGEQLTPGVNSLFYTLRPEEQIFLAEQAAAQTLESLKKIPPSEQAVVLIIPQDFQIDINQIDKYQRYYPTEQEFLRWKTRVRELSETLTKLENQITTILEAQNVRVVRFSTIASASATNGNLFDKYSHHLTASSHGMIAGELASLLAP